MNEEKEILNNMYESIGRFVINKYKFNDGNIENAIKSFSIAQKKCQLEVWKRALMRSLLRLEHKDRYK